MTVILSHDEIEAVSDGCRVGSAGGKRGFIFAKLFENLAL